MNTWQLKRLDEVATFRNGLWKGKNPPFVNTGVIRNTNFTKEGTLDDSDIAYLPVEEKQFKSRKLQPGDLILEKSGGGPKQAVGRVILFDKAQGDFSFSNFTSAIRVDDTTLLDPRYLHLYLHWFHMAGMTESMQSHSTGIRNLNVNSYKAVRVAFPPIVEQRRLIDFLGVAFANIATAKANVEKNLQNVRELFEGIMQSLFPQDADAPAEHSLGELSEFIVDCEHKTAPTQETGIPSIRTTNIGRGALLLEGVYRVSEETYNEWTRRAEPRAGDLILAREAPAGNVAVIPDGLKVCLGQRTVLIRPKADMFESAYLAHMLLQKNSQRRLLAHSRGATVQHINVKDIRSFKVAEVPPLSIQREIVAKVAKLTAQEEALMSLFERKLAALESLKLSVMAAAFSGKVEDRNNKTGEGDNRLGPNTTDPTVYLPSHLVEGLLA